MAEKTSKTLWKMECRSKCVDRLSGAEKLQLKIYEGAIV